MFNRLAHKNADRFHQVSSQLRERLALSCNKSTLLEKAAEPQRSELLTPEEAIRDPLVLEFLDMKDECSESDLESALIEPLADFRLEFDDDFAFIGRQWRLRIDDIGLRVDLVFFIPDRDVCSLAISL